MASPTVNDPRAQLSAHRAQLLSELSRGIADRRKLHATLTEILAIDRRLA